MSDELRIVVHGTPKPQGSKRPVKHRTTGKPILIESSGDALAYWRRAVTESALAALKADYEERISQPVTAAARFPLTGPVELSVQFSFKRPKSHWRTGANSHRLRDSAPEAPHGRKEGDLGKLVRAVEDSLTDAGVWDDDSQVMAYTGTYKHWCGSGAWGALDVPGAVIAIRSWPPEPPF